MHDKCFLSNHPSYTLCHVEDNTTSILCPKLSRIVQNIADIKVIMLNYIGFNKTAKNGMVVHVL